MSNYDFNSADKQGSFELIPAKTIVKVSFKINPGGVGDGGWLTISKNSGADMIAAEYTVTEGEYTRSKWWAYYVVDNGNETAMNISRQTLRAILESARNVNPDDASPAAMEKRQITNWGDFNGMEFICKVGIEKDKKGEYDDKNKILEVITPGMDNYTAISQSAPQTFTPPPQATTQPQNAAAPAWAQ
jgi:hypothetical protein